MSDRLAITPDEIRAMGRSTLERVAAYYETLPTRPVVVPSTSQAIRAQLDEPLPQTGADFETLLDTFDRVISKFSRHNGHPRFFGYVSSPGTPVTALGSMLASSLNANLTCWRSAPAGTELEHVTINWL
jgi:glutamate/tyrosine decarboxylase-like PLP-dependent enzyme